MKKIVTLLLAITMIVSVIVLASCGCQKKPVNTTPVSTEPTEIPVEPTTATEPTNASSEPISEPTANVEQTTATAPTEPVTEPTSVTVEPTTEPATEPTTEPTQEPHIHTWDDGVVTKEATHTEGGEITFTCTVCGATKVTTTEPEPTPEHTHVYELKYNDTEHYKECSICKDKKQINPHTWGTPVVTKQPTYTSAGKQTVECSVCKMSKTEEVDKLQARVEFVKRTKATISVDFYQNTYNITLADGKTFEVNMSSLEPIFYSLSDHVGTTFGYGFVSAGEIYAIAKCYIKGADGKWYDYSGGNPSNVASCHFDNGLIWANDADIITGVGTYETKIEMHLYYREKKESWITRTVSTNEAVDLDVTLTLYVNTEVRNNKSDFEGFLD